MAIVTRYFSTTAAGAGDGTTWADRAALFSSGNWSSVITGFNFSGSDGMLALIEGGLSYSCSQSLVTGLFANAPTGLNPLILHGCNSSGVQLSAPDPQWTADRHAFSTSTFPEIATTTNVSTINLTAVHARCVKFTASGRNGVMLQAGGRFDFIEAIQSTSNTAAIAVAGIDCVTNAIVRMTGSAYSSGMTVTNSQYVSNVKVIGNTGSSGNRDGVALTATTAVGVVSRVCSTGNGGHGFNSTSSGASQRFFLTNVVAVNNGGDGIRFASTASQSLASVVANSIITGNGGYGINTQAAANVFLVNSRLRNNTSGNWDGLMNYPNDFGTNTSAGSDSADYVDAATLDFQVKSSASIANLGFGISQQCASGGSGGETALAFVA